MRASSRIRCLFLSVLLACAAPESARAELSPAEWKRANRGLTQLMKSPGERSAKAARITTLGRDDSERAARLFVEWAIASHKLRRGTVLRALLTREKKLTAYKAKLAKRHKGDASRWKERERKDLAKLQAAYDAAQDHWSTESEVDRRLANTLGRMRAEAAWAWMFREGVGVLQKSAYTGALYRAVIARIEMKEDPAARVAILAVARGPAPPAARIRALDWAAARKPPGAWEAARVAVEDEVVAVRRAALRTMRATADPRSVEVLIAALKRADGLLATEIDALLGSFTGLNLEADADAWARWWAEHGATWKAKERSKAVARRPKPGDTSFYGITSPSKRIVFILDHSGSMQKPVRGLDAQTGKPRPGGTRMESALEELRRAIRALAQDVRFNVVFYSDGVTAWKPAPQLLEATKSNKAAVGRWLDGIEAEGTTALFDALEAALDYVDAFDGKAGYENPGVDTVFLLTDGVPTDSDGNEYTPTEMDGAMLRFLAANEVHRVVVHTVGIGRGHSRMLMERIANKTGGTYVAVTPD